jgi:uncharacterized protein YoxC
MQQQRREIDQVSQEIGKLQGQYDALAKGQEKLTGDVGELSNMVRSLVADSSHRTQVLIQLDEKVDKLNDVTTKMADVGLRLDDAKNHRQDQLFLRRFRKASEFVGRHASKAIVLAVAGAIATWSLSNYPAIAQAVVKIIGE